MMLKNWNYRLLKSYFVIDNNLQIKTKKLTAFNLNNKTKLTYNNNFINHSINGVNFFSPSASGSTELTTLRLQFLISYFKSFFKFTVGLINMNYKKGLIVCLLKGSYIVLKYYSKKLNLYYMSVFLPDMFTNTQFCLTEYYTYGNYFRFDLPLVSNLPHYCWYFFTKPADSVLFQKIVQSGMLSFSFSVDNDVIDSSDFYLPVKVYNLNSLYVGLLLMNIIFLSTFKSNSIIKQ